MLELGKNNYRWRWAAFGKHPSSKDYFRLGLGFPRAEFFADWLLKGYRGPSRPEKPPATGISAHGGTTCNRDLPEERRGIPSHSSVMPAGREYIWRFWARGERRKNIVCGFLRDSSDSIGRPFPLLIVGEGDLETWEEHWDLVPIVCDRTWSRLEYLSLKPLHDLKQFEREMFSTVEPCSDWSNAWLSIQEARTPSPETDGLPSYFTTSRVKLLPLTRCDVYEMFQISRDLLGNKISGVTRAHTMLKGSLHEPPHAVFVGGSFEKTFVVCFKRPLEYGDFAVLWSVLDA